jgi:hypothetical protein
MQSLILNKKNKNGSINLLGVTGEDAGAVISPYHPEFRSQIEDGVWPIVSVLVDKGYFVVDSCEGHLDLGNNDHSHFTVAFPENRDLLEFKNKINFLGVRCTENTFSMGNGRETEIINAMFLNNATGYQFLSVDIVPGNYLGSKLIKILLTKLIRLRVFNAITKIKNYERIY